MKTIILLALSLTTLAQSVTVGPNVRVKNLRLFYDQNEYFIKGVTYSPTPMAKMIESQTDGTGYCTPHQFVVPGQFSTSTISPCYYDDYMDATSYVGGPSGGMSALWSRDFPLIQSLGVNTIRTYHAHPVTQTSINSDSRYVNKTVQGSNHVPFLDAAQQYGLKVVFPLFADEVYLNTLSSDFIKLYITTLIDEVGYHPALLMYTFGNELQFFSRPASFLDEVNMYIDYARNYQNQRWGRAVPFSCALIDYPSYYNQMASDLHVDIMTTNAGYRGFDFSDLWSGSSQQLGWKTLSCNSGKPVLIGEMGVHSNTPVFDVPTWFPRMWSDILNHKAQGAIGGFLFSWSEEHWKGVAYYGQDYTTQPDVYMGLVRLTPGTGQFPVDNIVQKSGGAYDWNGAMTGYAMNQWAQDGPNTYSSVTNNLCQAAATSSAPAQANTANCPSGLSACGAACYNPTQYCCNNGNLQPAGNCPQSPTPTSSSTTSSSTSSTTSSAGASTFTTSAAATASSATCQKASYCPSTQCACNGACYDQSQYCCLSGQLTQISFCPKSNAQTTSSAPAVSPVVTSSTTSSTMNTPATSASTGSSGTTCQKASYCSAAQCACSGACYDQSQYCCVNGQLTQASFCPKSGSPAPSSSTSSSVSPVSSSTTRAAASPSTTSAAGTPQTTGQKASYCPPQLYACSGACYDSSQYCCLNGQLTQKSFC